MRNKIALVLFVKDEAYDLPGWIAWHLSSGFDSLIIYEDGSSDLTKEVIDAAANHFDVRRRPVPRALHFQHRQQSVYLDAAETLRNEFDWIGFIDADEYVYLPHHGDAHDFFASFDQNVGAVALNWCCYGSGWHVLKPGPNVPEQYEYRSNPDYFENLTVKSFVRARRMHLQYNDPHRFEVEGEIVNPFGQPVTWHPTERHRTAEAPDWSNGMILHYAIRSAEHYIEKVKRRSDIRNNVDIGFFTWLDRNDEHFRIPDEKLRPMNGYIALIQSRIKELRISESKNGKWSFNLAADSAALSPYRLRSHLGTQLYIDSNSGALIHGEAPNPETPPVEEVVIFLPDSDEGTGFLVNPNEDGKPIYIFGETQVSRCLPFYYEKTESDTICLRSLSRRKFLTCFNETTDDGRWLTTKIAADWPREWERLTVERIDANAFAGDNIDRWANALAASSFLISCFNGTPDDLTLRADCFAARIATLPDRVRTEFLIKNDLGELPWLGRVDAISF